MYTFSTLLCTAPDSSHPIFGCCGDKALRLRLRAVLTRRAIKHISSTYGHARNGRGANVTGFAFAVKHPMAVTSKRPAVAFKVKCEAVIVGDAACTETLSRHLDDGVRQSVEFVVGALRRLKRRLHTREEQNIAAQIVTQTRDKSLIEQQRGKRAIAKRFAN